VEQAASYDDERPPKCNILVLSFIRMSLILMSLILMSLILIKGKNKPCSIRQDADRGREYDDSTPGSSSESRAENIELRFC
jgi:hypothetical protein